MPKPFAKGNPGKPKGSLNKASVRVKEAYALLLEENLDTLQEDIDKLKPVERLRFMLDLSEYVIPKLARTEADITSGGEKIPMSDQEMTLKINELIRKISGSSTPI